MSDSNDTRRRNGILVATIVAVTMTVLGAYGVLRNDLVIPMWSRAHYGGALARTEYLHFRDHAARVVFAALVAIALGIVIGVYKRASRVPGARRSDTLEGGLLIAGLLLLVGMIVAKYTGFV